MRFILVSVLVFAACSTEQTAPSATSSAAEQQLRTFELNDRASARTVYAGLSNADRAALWTAQLDRVLATFQLDAEQTELVTYVRDHLDEAMANADAFEARARALMTEQSMKAVFGSLGNLREPPHDISGFYQPVCDDRWSCSTGCGCVDNTCPICPVSGGVTCTQQTCSHTCTASSSGCGWLWLQSCTGYSTSTEVDECT